MRDSVRLCYVTQGTPKNIPNPNPHPSINVTLVLYLKVKTDNLDTHGEIMLYSWHQRRHELQKNYQILINANCNFIVAVGIVL